MKDEKRKSKYQKLESLKEFNIKQNYKENSLIKYISENRIKNILDATDDNEFINILIVVSALYPSKVSTFRKNEYKKAVNYYKQIRKKEKVIKEIVKIYDKEPKYAYVLLFAHIVDNYLTNQITYDLTIRLLDNVFHSTNKFENYMRRIDNLYQILPYYVNMRSCSSITLMLENANKFEAEALNESLMSSPNIIIRAEDYRFINILFKDVPKHINSYQEISFDYLIEHAKRYYELTKDLLKYDGNRNQSSIFGKYYFPIFQNHKDELGEGFEKFNVNNFTDSKLLSYLAEGYRFIKYNPLSKTPLYDKWRVVLEHERKRSDNQAINLDFSIFEDCLFKEIIKDGIWEELGTTINKSQEFTKIIRSLKELLIFLPYIKDMKVYDSETCYQISTFYQTYKTTHILRYLSVIKRILLTAFNNNKIELSLNDLRFFDIQQYKPKTITRPHEHLQEKDKFIKVLKALKEKGKTKSNALLAYDFLALVLETGLRPASISGLKVNDLVETTNAKNYKEYFLNVRTKTNLDTKELVAVSNKTAELFKDALKVSEKTREECNNPELKEFLFLYRRSQLTYQVYSTSNITRWLEGVRKKLNLKITVEDFRKYAIAQQRQYAEEHNLSSLALQTLTSHKSIDVLNRNYNYYVDNKKIIELLYEAEVKEPLIKGIIVNKTEKEKAKQTEHNLGYCDSCHCSGNSYEPCLFCKSFRTSVDELDNFKKAIQEVDAELKKEEIAHERDFLQRYKEVLLSYTYKLEERKAKICH